MGLPGVDNGEFTFDQVRVPRANLLDRYVSITDVFTTFEGDNTVLLQLVAKGLLTNYRDSFESRDSRAMIASGARQFAGAVIERAFGGSIIQRLLAGAPGRDADDALADRGGELAIFEDREKHTVEAVAMRVRAASKTARDEPADDTGDETDNETDDETDTRAEESAADDFAMMNAVQGHLIAPAGRTSTDCCSMPSPRPSTRCPRVPPGISWVGCAISSSCPPSRPMRRGSSSTVGSAPPSPRDVTRQVDRLCDELADSAETFVAAFGLPDAWVDCSPERPRLGSARDSADRVTSGAPASMTRVHVAVPCPEPRGALHVRSLPHPLPGAAGRGCALSRPR